MNKLLPVFAAAICGLFASCATTEIRVAPPSRLVADTDPIELGEVIVLTEKLFSASLDKMPVSLVYDPRTDQVQMNYRNSTGGKVQLLLSHEARTKFIETLAEYNALYEKKDLKNFKGSSSVFGNAFAVLKWGGIMSMDAEGIARLEYGYVFKDGSPWFVFGVPVTQNEKYNESEMNYSKNSSPRLIYYSRALAAEFASLLDQEMLEALVNSSGELKGSPDSF